MAKLNALVILKRVVGDRVRGAVFDYVSRETLLKSRCFIRINYDFSLKKNAYYMLFFFEPFKNLLTTVKVLKCY